MFFLGHDHYLQAIEKHLLIETFKRTPRISDTRINWVIRRFLHQFSFRHPSVDLHASSTENPTWITLGVLGDLLLNVVTNCNLNFRSQ